jgi:Alpha/beta hydrolase family
MKRWLARILAALGIVLALAVIGFVAWGSLPQAPTERARAALTSDASVNVEIGTWISFTPAAGPPTTGLIVYPGGHVDARAYAPLARQTASYGYQVVIVPMPLSLAVLAPNRALEVIAAHPAVTSWAIGGHSLGGAMAARFAYSHPGSVRGLVLWAAYPPSGDDLSDSELAVASIYGLLDGLSTGDKIAASRPLLPDDTRWVPIEGGNHAQFGDYGAQSGDGTATISTAEQQRQAVEATIEVLRAITEWPE